MKLMLNLQDHKLCRLPATTKKKKVVIEKTDTYYIKQVTKVHTINKYKQTLCTSVMRQGHSIVLVIILTQTLTLG